MKPDLISVTEGNSGASQNNCPLSVNTTTELKTVKTTNNKKNLKIQLNSVLSKQFLNITMEP